MCTSKESYSQIRAFVSIHPHLPQFGTSSRQRQTDRQERSGRVLGLVSYLSLTHSLIINPTTTDNSIYVVRMNYISFKHQQQHQHPTRRGGWIHHGQKATEEKGWHWQYWMMWIWNHGPLCVLLRLSLFALGHQIKSKTCVTNATEIQCNHPQQEDKTPTHHSGLEQRPTMQLFQLFPIIIK